jgi:translation initiation factor IF-1
MAVADAIRVEGVVVEVKSGRLAIVALANGHRLHGHAARAQVRRMKALKAGDAVTVELSPADMSNGRIRFNETRQTT